MTVSASRVQFIWSPLLGWALLTCVAPAALAQVGVPVPGVTIGTISPNDPTVSAPNDQAPQTTTPTGTTTSGGINGPVGSTLDVTPTTTVAPPAIALPPGTTVQNPSTQIIPGASDVFAGATSGVIGLGSGGAPGGDELGITLGSFRLYPQIDVTTSYDNNVFAQGGANAPTGSLSTIIAPSLALRSDWLNHSINILMGGGFGYYQAAPTQNYQNYFFIVDGRIDIRSDWFATWSVGYRRATEALGTPNVAFAQAPTVAESIPLVLSTTKTFNRVSVEVGGSATKSWFTDHSTITSLGLDGASRNRTDFEEHVRLGYDISDDLTLYVTPSINQVRYDQTVDSNGQNRNSSGAGLGFGASWKINPTSTLNGNIGYVVTNSAGGLGTTSAYVFALSGTWNGYQPLTIRPNLTRGITETALSAYRNTITTVLGVDYSYQLFDEWAIAGGTSYSMADYQPIDGLGASPREDTFFRSSIGLLWQPRPQLSIGPIFEYSQAGSSDSTNGPSYNRQIISIRLTAKR
jgi:hypothetical protein